MFLSYFFFKCIYLVLLYLKGKETETHRKTEVFFIDSSTLQMSTTSRAEPGHSYSPGFNLGFPLGWQGPKFLGHTPLHGVRIRSKLGFKVELGLQPVSPTCDANSSIAIVTMVLNTHPLFFHSLSHLQPLTNQYSCS